MRHPSTDAELQGANKRHFLPRTLIPASNAWLAENQRAMLRWCVAQWASTATVLVGNIARGRPQGHAHYSLTHKRTVCLCVRVCPFVRLTHDPALVAHRAVVSIHGLLKHVQVDAAAAAVARDMPLLLRVHATAAATERHHPDAHPGRRASHLQDGASVPVCIL